MNTSHSSEASIKNKFEYETLLTEREYASIVKRSVASVRRDRALGQGCPYVKLGASVRYRRQDVLAYVEQNLRKLGSGAKVSEGGE